MLCYVSLCYVTLRYVMLRYVTLRLPYVTVTLRYVMLRYVMLCYVTLWFNKISREFSCWGPFLESPGKLSGPVGHPVSSRKRFSKLPLFSIQLILPVTYPVIKGRSWPPVKLPGSHKCCKTKQNPPIEFKKLRRQSRKQRRLKKWFYF